MDDEKITYLITTKLARAAANNDLKGELERLESMILGAAARIQNSDMPITPSQNHLLADGVNLAIR